MFLICAHVATCYLFLAFAAEIVRLIEFFGRPKKQKVVDSLSGLVSRTGSAPTRVLTTLLLGACALFAKQGAVVDGPQFSFMSLCWEK